MQESVSRFNRGSNEASSGMATCPHCGRSFACGGEVRKAGGGVVDERKKGYGMKGGIHDRPEEETEYKKGQGRKFGIYSDGGEVEPSYLGRKRERELPRHQLDVYRGEDVPRGEGSETEDEEEKRLAYAREIRRRRGY